jgi:hypothetical protein
MGNENELQESLFIQNFQQQNILIDEQRVIDLNPLYTLAKVTTIHHVVWCLLPVQFASYQYAGNTYTGQVHNIQ